MQQAPTTFDWAGLLRLVLLWLVVVFLALRALDLLFPRLRRDDEEASPLPGASPAGQPAISVEAAALATSRPGIRSEDDTSTCVGVEPGRATACQAGSEGYSGSGAP